MTVKDLAELSLKFDSACQKYAPSASAFLSVTDSSISLSILIHLHHPPSPSLRTYALSSSFRGYCKISLRSLLIPLILIGAMCLLFSHFSFLGFFSCALCMYYASTNTLLHCSFLHVMLQSARHEHSPYLRCARIYCSTNKDTEVQVS